MDSSIELKTGEQTEILTNQPENLQAHTIELTGKHLIEASAGTGKTFNITRIYLRLLLERKLPVEQILVMTFGNDATEEIRGRIDEFLRESINNWHTLIEEDDYFIEIAKKIETPQALVLLKQALLYLDEAAIYTLHGFCKRILSQHAFASGISFNALMETDSREIMLQSCQDWYRILAKQSTTSFLSIATYWPTPSAFLSDFSKAINKEQTLSLITANNLLGRFISQSKTAENAIIHHYEDLISYLVDVKKGIDREQRLSELDALKAWLMQVSKIDITCFNDSVNANTKPSDIFTPMPDAFLDGRRYGRSKNKTDIIAIFEPINAVKTAFKQIDKAVDKANAYALVKEGIEHIREQVRTKKQALNILTFDDLITTLADKLSDNVDTDGKLASTLLAQYPVALVDEFQDTDPQQFAILQAIYSSPVGGKKSDVPSALYMIGDPKQAIYGFRGGDVFAYLSARNDTQYQWLMDTNWRSSTEMVTGYNRLFYGNRLTEDAEDVFGYGIPYSPVKHSGKPSSDKVDNSASSERKALQFVHFTDNESSKKEVTQDRRADIAQWCANEIVQLLSPLMKADNGVEDTPLQDNKAQVQAQDIAILVRDGGEAKNIKLALQKNGLSSVYLSNRSNLLHSEQAKQLNSLLKGILFIESEQLFTAALVSGLLGFTPKKLYILQQDEHAWQELRFTFSALRNEWLYKGFISMALQLMHEHFEIEGDDQDRSLTNLLHLFELLQAASQRHAQPQELLFWFEQQISSDTLESEAELRLESDDNLIRIVTQHGSKGLEYPVVFVPFVTRHKDPLTFGKRNVALIEYHDKNQKLILSLDGDEAGKKAMADEAYAEAIRLLYVAVTRAEQRCYLCTTAFNNYQKSPLGLTLHWQKNDDIALSLQNLITDEPEAIGLLQTDFSDVESDEIESKACDAENNTAGLIEKITADNSVSATTQVATFSGKIERDWWLSSFSAINKNLRHAGVSTPDRDNQANTRGTINTKVEAANIEAAAKTQHLIRFNLSKGAHTGNLLHDILEHTNFVQPQWDETMKWPLVRYGELNPINRQIMKEHSSADGIRGKYNQDDLSKWLQQVLNTPLIEANCCLADIDFAHSLRESEFYFPMHSAQGEQLTEILHQHRQSSLSEKSEKNTRANTHLPHYYALKGMMHGFIDLIFESQGQYFVCDYKSNHLGDHYSHYEHQALQQNVESNNYDLQYLIYSLALHRYLQQNLPDYDPTVHFGGVYYFYLRGMTDENVISLPRHDGDDQQSRAGVFFKMISTEILQQLDRLFSGDAISEDLDLASQALDEQVLGKIV